VKAIARELGMCPKTVRRVLDKKGRVKKPRERKPSKLDPYRALIRYKALELGWQAREIFKEIRALGYPGGETILKDYVRQIRPKPAKRPALRFETGPGKQGQVDLSPYEILIGGILTAVICFSFVLAWSRWRFFMFVRAADRFTIMLCHRLAFEELGGMPAKILYDRMKQVVVAVVDGEPLLQEDFARFVNHYGFGPRVLDAGHKEAKGKVEKPYQDVQAFLRHRTFHSLDDLNHQAWTWRHEELHVTPHKTTGERPADRLVHEQPVLLPLPAQPFRCEQRARAHTGKHFHVEHLKSFYSVPPQFADRWVTKCVLNGRLWVELGGEVISEHELVDRPYQYITLPEHKAAFRQMGTYRRNTRKQFLNLGPAAERYAEGLDRIQAGASTYHMIQILKLVERIGRERVVDALRYATRYEAFSHTQVARIVKVRRLRCTAAAVEEALGVRSGEVDDEPPAQSPGLAEPRNHQRPLAQYEAVLREKSRRRPDTQEEPDGE
jgi:transposase